MNIEALDKFDRMETSKPKEADKPFFEDSEPPDDMVSPILGGISKYEPENSPYSEIKTSDMPHWSDEPFLKTLNLQRKWIRQYSEGMNLAILRSIPTLIWKRQTVRNGTMMQ